MAEKKKAAAKAAAGPEVEADAGNVDVDALIEAFTAATPQTLANLDAVIKRFDDQIGRLQADRRGFETMRKSLFIKINGRPKQISADEQEARREEIFHLLEEFEEEGLLKMQIAKRTGIPAAGVTTALKHPSFSSDGRRWKISENYQKALAGAQGR